ncbi:protein angel homolog 2 [Elysia marginata]|uniref:Protein angel homolog 2 n=1 Tax=Elysia marginata TaxID=1093978 RepID=A0AAV4HQR7_9GAST|nr:protein angel homolog 2 [Elysia marginata]
MSEKSQSEEERKTQGGKAKVALEKVRPLSASKRAKVKKFKAGNQTKTHVSKHYGRPNDPTRETKAKTKVSAFTESVDSAEPGGSGQRPHSGKSRGPSSAKNHFVSKNKPQQKRPRPTSSSSKGKPVQHQQKSPLPGSYRTTKRWRKLLEMKSTAGRCHQAQQAQADGSGLELSVMSYNILSQQLLEMHSDLYTQCRSQDLAWPQRGAAILQEIINHNSDIICLQEVEADHWIHDIRPILNHHGYFGFHKKRDGDKPDGCAILYKKSKFTHVKFVPVQFLQGGVLDRDNVGIILLLKPRSRLYKGKAKTICVATSHLLFNPRRGDVKLAQLMMFLAEIDKVAALEGQEQHKAATKQPQDGRPGNQKRKYPQHKGFPQNASHVKSHSSPDDMEKTLELAIPAQGNPALENTCFRQRYCPIILCGDFNTEPFCDMYRFITSGQIKYEGLVSRLICGQREGKEGGADIYLGSSLLPTHLGVTESCQYVSVLQRRQRFAHKYKKPSTSGKISNVDNDLHHAGNKAGAGKSEKSAVRENDDDDDDVIVDDDDE